MNDNAFLDSKLKLRKYFLEKYHADTPVDLLETHQGAGVLWNKLRRDFPLRSRLGIDKKYSKGRLRIDSAKYLKNPLPQNVIDIDAYGSPFAHYDNLLMHSTGEKTIFLTSGLACSTGMAIISHMQLRALGLWPMKKYLTPTMQAPLQILSEDQMIFNLPTLYGWEIVQACESTPGPRARYFGIHLKK